MNTSNVNDPSGDVEAPKPAPKQPPKAPPAPPSPGPRRPTVRARPPAPAPAKRTTPASSNWILMAALFVALAWSGGAAAYVLGFYGISTVTGGGPERLLGFAFIVIGPALLLVTLGVVTSEFLRLASLAQSIDVATRRLAAPVDHAQGDARRLADIIAHEVDRVSRSAESALNQLGAMEEVLRHHAEGVNSASGEARQEVDHMIEQLRGQRQELGSTVQQLNDESRKISEAFDRQAEMISAAADLAAAHADEGRQMLEQGAERLQSTAAHAQQSGEKAAFAISEQMRDMDILVKALDDRAERLENLAKAQEDNLRVVQSTAHDLNLASEAGAESMKSAVDTALDQARRLSDMIEQEMRAISSKSAEDIERVRAAADTARLGAENAGRSLEANAAAVIERVEQLNDASLHIASRMEEALQSRMHNIESLVARLEDRLNSIPAEAPGQLSGHASGHAPGPSSGHWQDAPAEPPLHREPPRRDAPGRDFPPPRTESFGGRDIPLHTEDEFDNLPAPRAPRASRYDDAAPRYYDDAPRFEDAFDDRSYNTRGNGAREAHGRDYPARDSYRDAYDDPMIGSDAPNGRYDDAAFDDRFNGYEDDHRRGLDAAPSPANLHPMADDHDGGDWRMKDLLRNAEEEAPPPPRGGNGAGAAVVTSLRRAGVDPAQALDADITARIARARRRAGVGEARALVLDSALNDVRRTAAALAADPTLRGRAEGFLDDHARMVRRAVDQNDVAGLSALLDTDPGRAYLLIDAALADV